MASPQEQADAAYRAYESARSTFNLASQGVPVPGGLDIARQRLQAAEAASHSANDALRATYNQPPPGSGGTSGGGGGGGMSQYDLEMRLRNEQRAYEREQRQRQIIQTLQAAFSSYGLQSLFPKIAEFARRDLTEDGVLLELRKTPEYKQRFPAIEPLAQKGRVITEAEYIQFERNAAQLERAYGLPAGMLDDRATVANLLTNEVSARELEERVTLAAAGAFQTSPEMRDTFQRFYGIESGGLTAYFLDPEKALPLLNKQYAASQIGAEAAMQDVTIQSRLAEQITEAGIGREEARAGFGRVAGMASLAEGRGDLATQGQAIGAELLGQEAAQEAVQRAQAARRGRFQQGGGAITSQQGVIGAGTAATR
jgi:hypothetical protein